MVWLPLFEVTSCPRTERDILSETSLLTPLGLPPPGLLALVPHQRLELCIAFGKSSQSTLPLLICRDNRKPIMACRHQAETLSA